MGQAFDAQLAGSTSWATTTARSREMPGPRTLHRLLGYSPTRKRFHYHRNNPLEARLVIVDEASMIDLFVMERLVDATPADASLVLVGRRRPAAVGQLGRGLSQPDAGRGSHTETTWRTWAADPVEPRETAGPAASQTVRLETNYRMEASSEGGAEILRAASAINEGRFLESPTEESLADIDAPEPGVVVIRRGESASVRDIAQWWYDHLIASMPDFKRAVSKPLDFDGESFSDASSARLESVFEHYARTQLLTLTRVLPTGSKTLNQICHRRHLDQMRFRSADFVAGEPILMRENDYQRGLFNGDHGVISSVRVDRSEGVKPMAVFRRGDRYVPFGLMALGSQI